MTDSLLQYLYIPLTANESETLQEIRQICQARIEYNESLYAYVADPSTDLEEIDQLFLGSIVLAKVFSLLGISPTDPEREQKKRNRYTTAITNEIETYRDIIKATEQNPIKKSAYKTFILCKILLESMVFHQTISIQPEEKCTSKISDRMREEKLRALEATTEQNGEKFFEVYFLQQFIELLETIIDKNTKKNAEFFRKKLLFTPNGNSVKYTLHSEFNQALDTGIKNVRFFHDRSNKTLTTLRKKILQQSNEGSTEITQELAPFMQQLIVYITSYNLHTTYLNELQRKTENLNRISSGSSASSDPSGPINNDPCEQLIDAFFIHLEGLDLQNKCETLLSKCNNLYESTSQVLLSISKSKGKTKKKKSSKNPQKNVSTSTASTTPCSDPAGTLTNDSGPSTLCVADIGHSPTIDSPLTHEKRTLVCSTSITTITSSCSSNSSIAIPSSSSYISSIAVLSSSSPSTFTSQNDTTNIDPNLMEEISLSPTQILINSINDKNFQLISDFVQERKLTEDITLKTVQEIVALCNGQIVPVYGSAYKITFHTHIAFANLFTKDDLLPKKVTTNIHMGTEKKGGSKHHSEKAQLSDVSVFLFTEALKKSGIIDAVNVRVVMETHNLLLQCPQFISSRTPKKPPYWWDLHSYPSAAWWDRPDPKCSKRPHCAPSCICHTLLKP